MRRETDAQWRTRSFSFVSFLLLPNSGQWTGGGRVIHPLPPTLSSAEDQDGFFFPEIFSYVVLGSVEKGGRLIDILVSTPAPASCSGNPIDEPL